MAVELHTEQVYTDWQASGIAVSRSSNISCQALADSACSSLGSRCLRDTLLYLGLGHVRHPWCMSHFTGEQRSNVFNLPFSRVGFLPFPDIRHPPSPFFFRNALRSHQLCNIFPFPSYVQPCSRC